MSSWVPFIQGRELNGEFLQTIFKGRSSALTQLGQKWAPRERPGVSLVFSPLHVQASGKTQNPYFWFYVNFTPKEGLTSASYLFFLCWVDFVHQQKAWGEWGALVFSPGLEKKASCLITWTWLLVKALQQVDEGPFGAQSAKKWDLSFTCHEWVLNFIRSFSCTCWHYVFIFIY